MENGDRPWLAKPVLVFTWGNPSRGDDAIGPAVFERLGQHELADVEVLTDFQLQVEHAIDLLNRRQVLFVDAGVDTDVSFRLQPLLPSTDIEYTTHQLNPASLLGVYQNIYGQAPPPAFLLTITGCDFGLGKAMTPQADSNVQSAIELILELVKHADTEAWNSSCGYQPACETVTPG